MDKCATGGEYFNFVDDSVINQSIYNIGIFDYNTYIVYGEHLNEPIEDEFYENISYTCESWDIVYPIQRSTLFGFALPKRYLCIFDLIGLF